ncbi:KikA (plasmid) [Pseudomonas fluorescens R124]|uniref:KikA n=2 Tax=Pseudomonas fluorescens TaxID=294 RepID=K0WRW6_PSEFL|nr:TrbM/KikA/MpfK family conjugal transfer protein [Pseudomonas fluorescens]AFS51716.1 KikA [Pseudomonas fluorescens R124]EJZ60961.1 KikA [Pseudomonas fluorescens R124]
MKSTVNAAGRVCPAANSTYSRAGKYAIAGLLAVTVLVPVPAFAKYPCKTVICMWGLFNGKVQDGCDQAIEDHFDIVVYKKKKKIDWNSTAKQRLAFTNSCPGSDQGFNKKINDKFGKSSR